MCKTYSQTVTGEMADIFHLYGNEYIKKHPLPVHYLKVIHDKISGDAPSLNLEFEKRVHIACLQAIDAGIVKSATDISDGGLAVAVSECCIKNTEKTLGASVYIYRKMRDDELFFGETQSVIVLTINEKDLLKLETIAGNNSVPCVTIGRVKEGGMLKLNDSINISVDELKDAYLEALPKAMDGELL